MSFIIGIEFKPENRPEAAKYFLLRIGEEW